MLFFQQNPACRWSLLVVTQLRWRSPETLRSFGDQNLKRKKKVEILKITQQDVDTRVQHGDANTTEVGKLKNTKKIWRPKIQTQEKAEVPKITQQAVGTNGQHTAQVEEPEITLQVVDTHEQQITVEMKKPKTRRDSPDSARRQRSRCARSEAEAGSNCPSNRGSSPGAAIRQKLSAPPWSWRDRCRRCRWLSKFHRCSMLTRALMLKEVEVPQVHDEEVGWGEAGRDLHTLELHAKHCWSVRVRLSPSHHPAFLHKPNSPSKPSSWGSAFGASAGSRPQAAGKLSLIPGCSPP